MQAVASVHYRRQQAITAAVSAVARKEWAALDAADLDGTWRPVAARVLAGVVAGQVAAASQAEPYVRRALAEQGIDAPPEAVVRPRAFAGRAADGRSLVTLLGESVIAAKAASAAGGSLAEVSAAGLVSLLRIVGSEVTDAGRSADGVAIVARPRLTGYVRMLTPPSCSRCAILAGRWYRWSAGFQRHRGCDCVHVPSLEDTSEDLRTDPMQAFRSGKVTGLSKAETKAVNDGADLAKVVNAHRSGYTPANSVERIYSLAPDRETAIKGLRNAGYLI